MSGSCLKEGRIIQDEQTYLCLIRLFADAAKRSITSVVRRIFPFDVCIGGSLYSVRGSGEEEKISPA